MKRLVFVVIVMVLVVVLFWGGFNGVRRSFTQGTVRLSNTAMIVSIYK